MSNNFFEALHQVAVDKGINRESIEEIVESAMLSAYKKQYGTTDNAKVTFNRDNNTVSVVSRRMVVRKPNDKAMEISYDIAKKIYPDVQLGDEVDIEENPLESFGRIAAQTAKQVIIQKIKEEEKGIVYNEYKDKEGQLINGYVQRKVKDALFIDLGKAEGVLPAREQSPLEHFKPGERVKAILLSVSRNAKGPAIILSRAHPKFVEKLFEMEIPEIYDGVVQIVTIVREAGFRTKVAVTSGREDIDAVGACVGMKGIRIQSIVRELEGEKIDIIDYSADPQVMATNALTPAKPKEIVRTKENGVIAVVEEDQLRLAIGKGGHNARLASKLCGFDIDIKTESQYHELLSSTESRSIVDQLFNETPSDETPLEELPKLESRMIKLLEAAGIFSIEDLVEVSFEDLMKIDGIGKVSAQKIMDILRESIDFEEDDDDDEEEDIEENEAEDEDEEVEAEEIEKEE
ncbi:MAG: transcription termination/antitermination protein NusA [Spirochaetes bacterium]|nr:transcription termination/antitermination protein NusA [Spirochaetota bacterium]